MKSLQNFFKTLQDGEFNDEQYVSLISDSSISRRKRVETRVIDEITKKALGKPGISHDDLIDFLIFELLQRKQDNRITKGYTIATELGVNTVNVICNPSNSFHVNYLKSSPWRLVHYKIGDLLFIELILHYNCFIQIRSDGINNQFQLFGESYHLNHSTNAQDIKSQFLSKNKMLYKESHHFKRLNPIPLTKRELLNQIFSIDYKNQSIPKKFRKFHHFLGRIIRNHQNCNYTYIIDDLCPAQREYKGKDIREVGTAPKDVIRFVISILDTVFPIQLFGSKYNKRIIFLKVAEFIATPRTSKSFLLNDIKIKDIEWLSNGCDNLNKQDLLKRQRLFLNFLTWMHSAFISKLIACFFHVTETTESQLLFYRHHLWQKLTKPFVDRYFAKFLSSSHLPNYSFVEAEKIQGKLRLIPKSKDFRVINVPFKGFKDEQFQYWNYLNREVKPVRSILIQARKKSEYSWTYCFSTADVLKRISKYREGLPKLKHFYYIKFDAKSCYDTLPQSKVIQSASKLIPPDKTFACRQLYTGSTLDKIKPTTMITDDVSKLDITKGTDFCKEKYIFDQASTVVLNSEDIMKIIDMQLNETVVQIKRRCYSRKIGVFQGFPLSSIFCDIVYDEMIQEHLKFVLDDPQSLLLRLADDFMCISTDPEQIRKVLQTIQGGFGDFNLSINNDKTRLKLKRSDKATHVLFCGLTIDLKDLTVIKDEDSYGMINFTGSSYKELHKKLLWLLKTHLHNKIIIANDYRCIEINLQNSLNILRNVVKNYLQNKNKRSIQQAPTTSETLEFFETIIGSIWKALKINDKDLQQVNELWYEIFMEECHKVISELS